MLDTIADRAYQRPISQENIGAIVEGAISATAALDVHTHLYAPGFGQLGLWGIDDLLTYHYLEAELFRFSRIRTEQYWTLEKTQKADLIWKTLFVDNVPLSEATRGVVAVLDALGLDTASTTVGPLREYFRSQRLAEYVPRVFRLAGVESVVMTNDPLDANEVAFWNDGLKVDPRFRAALRLDRILNEWSDSCGALVSQGYRVERDCSCSTMSEVRRFVEDWARKTSAVYMAVSLPDSFAFPADDVRTRLLTGAILPTLREAGVPLALMIGVRRQVNPALRDAGDASGQADLRGLERLCREYPENRFLATALSRENQHELCVYARKFANLMPFGCWWFLNNPSVVEEITRERFEMLGASFIPQHSDARVLEQIIYKWRNTRRTLAPLLTERFRLLAEDGRPVTHVDVEQTVAKLLRTNFEEWTNPPQLRADRISR